MQQPITPSAAGMKVGGDPGAPETMLYKENLFFCAKSGL